MQRSHANWIQAAVSTPRLVVNDKLLDSAEGAEVTLAGGDHHHRRMGASLTTRASSFSAFAR